MKAFRILFLLLTMVVVSCKSDDENGQETDPREENLKALGTSAEDFLADAPYNKMVVELIYPTGFEPQQETINNFRSFLQNLLNKPDGITIIVTNIELPTGSPYTTSEVRQIEENNRTLYTTDDTIALSVLFLNGKKDGDTNTSVTLGTAYQNTSIVMYQKTIRDVAASNDIDLMMLETTTLEHEFGHILSLVGITDDDIHANSSTTHEDPDHSGHCVVKECLMYYQIDATGRSTIQRLKQLQEIPTFDSLCLEDLQAKGAQ